MAEKRPALADDEYAHDVEPDPDVLRVQGLGEVGRLQSLERRAVRVLLGESLAAVLCDLAVDERQLVLVAGDEVGDVAAVRPALFQDLEALRSRWTLTPFLALVPMAFMMSSLAPCPHR